MHGSQQRSTATLLVRALLPSFTSGMLCLLFSLVAVFLHIIMLSLKTNTALPDLLGGHAAESYSAYIAQPLNGVLGNLRLESAMVVVLWGLAGLFVYSVLEQAIRARRDWREAEHNVQFINAQTIVQHPLQKNNLTIVGWKLGVSVLIVLAVFAMQPLLRTIYQMDMEVLRHLDFKSFAIAMTACVIVLHVCVVLVRLYVMRTRVFGN